ncbi:histidine kinase [Methylophaga sp. 42_25_T18]|nr:histidine kinase [Methylophaga sp. 42_25_T18]
MNQEDNKKDKGLNYRTILVNAGSMHWVHWLVVLLSVVVTIVAWSFTKEQLNQKIEAKFLRESEQVIELVKERMALYENALWSGVALMDVNTAGVSHQQWYAFSHRLNIDQTYPGINGMGVIYNIQPPDLEAYLEQQRFMRPNFYIHPQHNNKEYWPITYIEPEASNLQAIGLDMAFEMNRYTAITKARDTGSAQLTGPITLVQDDKKTPGFLFYTPFYKNGISPSTMQQRIAKSAGVTYAPFIMYKLMQGTLAKQKRQVYLAIKDGESLLFADDERDKDSQPLFMKQESIEMYGRTWRFDIQSDLSFRYASANNQPAMILIGGLIIDTMLLGLFIFLSRANRKALVYADQVTAKLKIKADHLEKSNNDLEQFSYIASHDLKSPLNAIKQLSAWIEEDCAEILPDESKEHLNLVQKRTDRMMKLLSDLLSYSRLNHTSYEYKTINLAALVKDCFELLGNPEGFSYTATDVDLNIPVVPFEIVLRNLLSNSIKHHDQHTGDITVSYERQVDVHCIQVKDDGPGIPKHLQQRAMEMFQTLKPRDKVEGSGMGLSMVKRIIDYQEGTIEIESEGERGTTFIIHWPVTAEAGNKY